MIFSCSILRIGLIEKFITKFKTTVKLIGHRTRFQGNDDLPPAIKKKPPFFSVRALIMHEIMGSRDARCK